MDPAQVEGGPVLSPEGIFLGRTSQSQDEAIDFVGGELVRRGVVAPAYVASMKRREETVSTYLGNGVALPHGTFDAKDEIAGTAIIVAQYPDGVDWNGETAHLVIGLAAVGDDHVQVLSQLADVLQDEELCAQLWKTDDADFVFETLTSSDDDEETTTTVIITNPAGLHARPAAAVVEIAKSSEADIHITKGGKSVSAKSILGVLSLGAATGDSVTVTASGDGATEAVDMITQIMTTTDEEH